MTIKTIQLTIKVEVTDEFGNLNLLNNGIFISSNELLELKKHIAAALFLTGIVQNCSVEQRIIAEMVPVRRTPTQ